MARASILWLIAEYAEPKIAPDVLRRIAKTFCQEEDIVKLQALNLASRLALTNNQPQTKLIVQYIFNLAKYDQNYDTRDRVRFLRHLCTNPETTGLNRYAKKLLLSSKPAPKLQSTFSGRDQYQMGSLSHLINQPAAGYQELPDFPDEAPDPSVRNVTPPPTPIVLSEARKSKDFYAESEEGSQSDSASESSSSNTTESDSDGDSEEQGRSEEGDKSATHESSSASDGTDDSQSDSSTDDSEIVRKAQQFKISKRNNANGAPATNGDSKHSTTSKPRELITSEASLSSSESEQNKTPGSESDNEDTKVNNNNKQKRKDRHKSKRLTTTKKPAHSVDLLLDLDMGDMQFNIPAPTLPVQLLTAGVVQAPKPKQEPSRLVTPVSTPIWASLKRGTLVNAKEWNGLEVMYRYTRCENIFSSRMTSIEISFDNRGDRVFQEVAVKAADEVSLEVRGSQSQVPLGPGASFVTTIGVNFKDSAQEVRLELTADDDKREIRLTPAICEIVRPVIIARPGFDYFKRTLRGMCQFDAEITCSLEFADLREKLQQYANVMLVAEGETGLGGTLRFAAQTLNTCSLVLVEVTQQGRSDTAADDGERVRLVVNCELITVGQMLLTQIKEALTAAGR